MTERLKSVGLWAAEQQLDTTSCLGWIHPRHLQQPGWAADDRDRILAYLRSGVAWAGYQGQSRCRLGCETLNGSGEQTDGVWAWPAGLAHDVEVHDVRLPDEFVATMRAHRFTVPEDAAAQRKQHLDGEPWLRWCAEQVPARPVPEDAITLLKAQSLAAALSVPGYQAQVRVVHQRWLIAIDFPGARVVDLIPPCSAATLALHLHRWRRVPPEQQLSIEAAQQLLEESLPTPSAWARLGAWLRPGRTPPRVVLEDSGFWCLSSGTAAATLMPLDEPGWRFLLTQLRPGDPAVYAAINRRLLAALGT